MKIVSVFLDNVVYSIDRMYDYVLSKDMENTAKKYMRICVPFGRYNVLKQAIIIDVKENDIQNDKVKLKETVAFIDDEQKINKEMIELALIVKKRYFCTFFQALNLIIPAGLKYSFVTYITANANCEVISSDIDKRKAEIMDFVNAHKGEIKESLLESAFSANIKKDVKELCYRSLLKRTVKVERKIKDASVKVYSLKGKKSKYKLTQKQKSVCDYLKENPKSSVKEICYYTSVSISVIKTLEVKGVIISENEKQYRTPEAVKAKGIDKNVVLSCEQENAFSNLKGQFDTHKASVSLLYGVTGSGKTSVFMKLIEYVHSKAFGIILMVPEIALTSKLISLFRGIYGESVAIIHSGLSLGERLDEFERIESGEASIVIGTRSAVFAPVKNIGLIIMDEEQEGSYKSEQTPTFHARDIAKILCAKHSAMLLLCSATPSLKSYYMAQKGKYSLNKLTKRYGNAILPDVHIVDMNEELLNGNNSIFSGELIERINGNIENNEQSILLLNRRGYHTFACCRACGEVVTCPNCSISLTYHCANNKLMCHYCGYSREYTDICPSCGETQVQCTGFGTQKIERDLKEYLPHARILRMDADTTTRKHSLDRKLQQFDRGEFDILIGTQMVAKGLDFPNVTLVGVILADQSLYSDEFRSYERAFDLLTQVVGRSGRGDKKGTAIIQTYTPENPIIQMAAEQDYDAFYKSEIVARQGLLYPPFADICLVSFSSLKDENISTATNYFLSELKRLSSEEYKEQPLRVLRPTPANILKVQNKYRHKIIIKCKNNARFREMMSRLLIIYAENKQFKDVNISADINPNFIL